MAHYALLDDDNVVTQVISGRDEYEILDDVTSWEDYYSDRHGQTCKRTSYNTRANQRADGGVPFRGHYAGIGYTFDPDRDAFIVPQPFPSWVLNEDTLTWEAPVPPPAEWDMPIWDEDAQEWFDGQVS